VSIPAASGGDRSIGERLSTLIGSSFPSFAMLYAALFGAFGTESPFFPSFLAERGLSPTEIAAALAAGTMVRLTSGPLAGMAADLFGTKRILALAAALAGAIILLYIPGASFWPLLLVCMAHSIAITPLNPLADALALPASIKEGVFSYGAVRGVGSASFVVGTMASGFLVARYGLDSIIVSASVLFVLMVPSIPFLPPTPRASADTVKGALFVLLAIPPYRRMLVIAAMVIGSHAMSDTFAVIHWRTSGISSIKISILLAEAVTSEIVVFIVVGPLILRRLGPARCLAIAAGAGIVRWAVFATTTSVGVLAVTEPLHGLTFALLHLACMRVISVCVPERLSATAQSIYGTLFLGISSATLTLASGSLYGRYGAPAFWAMSLLCVGALPLTRGLSKPLAE
jgi:MFS transporter, PPP family, 3-phenylpropionic acid transporter